jgi:hypothetical protein
MSSTIEFHVADAITGKGVPSCECIVAANGVQRSAKTDSEGNASITGLDTNIYELTVSPALNYICFSNFDEPVLLKPDTTIKFAVTVVYESPNGTLSDTA